MTSEMHYIGIDVSKARLDVHQDLRTTVIYVTNFSGLFNAEYT
jgi:hypothetical protein